MSTKYKRLQEIELWDRLQEALQELAVGIFDLLDENLRPTGKIRWAGEVVAWNRLFSDTGREGLVSEMKWDPIEKDLVVMSTYRKRLLDGLSFSKAKALKREDFEGSSK